MKEQEFNNYVEELSKTGIFNHYRLENDKVNINNFAEENNDHEILLEDDEEFYKIIPIEITKDINIGLKEYYLELITKKKITEI